MAAEERPTVVVVTARPPYESNPHNITDLWMVLTFTDAQIRRLRQVRLRTKHFTDKLRATSAFPINVLLGNEGLVEDVAILTYAPALSVAERRHLAREGRLIFFQNERDLIPGSRLYVADCGLEFSPTGASFIPKVRAIFERSGVVLVEGSLIYVSELQCPHHGLSREKRDTCLHCLAGGFS